VERFADEIAPAIIPVAPRLSLTESFVASSNLRSVQASPLFERYCVLLI
jgi:hypothetical protein